ncbi:hypothetical protein, partial [Nostoc sp.]|uniref:hypothetical protein n=1 Tax=Nostoc sp. TaxID=1180 RepID=UPI002FF8F1DB
PFGWVQVWILTWELFEGSTLASDFRVALKYLNYIFLPSSFCHLPSAFPQPRSPKVAKTPFSGHFLL